MTIDSTLSRVTSTTAALLGRGTLCLLLAVVFGCESPTTEAPQGTSPAATASAPPANQAGAEPQTPAQSTAPQAAQEVFWRALKTVCDQQFAGQLTIGTEESDRTFGLAQLRMTATRCSDDVVDLNLTVDDDASRTWMIRRTEEGLSLHHEHLGDDGQPDATSGYGGYTASEGTAIRQEFPADDNTGNMIPAAATNVWALEITPQQTFAYELQRIEEQRMFRIVFDLANPL